MVEEHGSSQSMYYRADSANAARSTRRRREAPPASVLDSAHEYFAGIVDSAENGSSDGLASRDRTGTLLASIRSALQLQRRRPVSPASAVGHQGRPIVVDPTLCPSTGAGSAMSVVNRPAIVTFKTFGLAEDAADGGIPVFDDGIPVERDADLAMRTKVAWQPAVRLALRWMGRDGGHCRTPRWFSGNRIASKGVWEGQLLAPTPSSMRTSADVEA